MIKAKVNGEIGLVHTKLNGDLTGVLAETVMLTTEVLKQLSRIEGMSNLDILYKRFVVALGISIETGKIEDLDSPEKASEYLRNTVDEYRKGIEGITKEQFDDTFDDMCDGFRDCTGCDYEDDCINTDHCKWSYLFDNYHITRK